MPVPNSATLQWAQRVLEGLNATPTATNMKLASGWIVAEHGWAWNGSGNNPLNTTWKLPGSTNFNNLGNGEGVQNYPSIQEGLQATIDTLTQQSPSFSTLVEGLRNADYNLFFSAQGMQELDTWGTAGPYCKSVVDSVTGIPTQYLHAAGQAGAGATVEAGPILQRFFSDINTGANDLANLLGLNQFIKPGANTKSIIVGAGVAALILWLIAEGADNA
ncbi:hypothetical protein [Sulfobacillus harzensis]|uniref:Uncharacterized protein n=1 Tax=Sulfobacillus harzensis TaxID=2729629 RepID=A0A7Y0L8V4_9FIRM|nr:hypothetical protein [Sulfobacillus harzensis]NMP24039.1 hypothetical protein [Sulfobacillus harzensis]